MLRKSSEHNHERSEDMYNIYIVRPKDGPDMCNYTLKVLLCLGWQFVTHSINVCFLFESLCLKHAQSSSPDFLDADFVVYCVLIITQSKDSG